MRRFPDPIQNCVSVFMKLPGVGPKTALRYVYALLKLSKQDIKNFSETVDRLHEKINVCNRCFTYTDGIETCYTCIDQKRRKDVLCVVEVARDISTIDGTNEYNGHFFVLGGVLNPIEGQTPDTLRIQELKNRLNSDPEINEVILALSPDIHGETTMMYLTKELTTFEKKLTRLARGLPTGAALEFADEVTLTDALRARRRIN